MGKGSNYERQMCREFSLWWTSGKDDSVYWRTSNSGGRATIRRRNNKRSDLHCGDMCAIDPIGQPLLDLVTIEIKRGYSKHSIADLLDRRPSAAQQLFEGFLEQAVDAARNAGTPHWLIVFRRDQRVPVVFFPHDLFVELGCFVSNHPTLSLVAAIKRKKGALENVWIFGMTLGAFFAGVAPGKVKTVSDLRQVL